MSDWQEFEKAVLAKMAASVDMPFSDLEKDLGNVENSIVREKLLVAFRKSREFPMGYVDPVKRDGE